MLKSDKSHSAAVYFDAKYHYKLASILLSIKQSKFSKRYAARVLRMFSNLLMSRMYAFRLMTLGLNTLVFESQKNFAECFNFKPIASTPAFTYDINIYDLSSQLKVDSRAM